MFQRTDDGFSLVEVLIAMLLLALLAVAVLPAFVSATAVSAENRDVVRAAALANARLALVRDETPLQSDDPLTCQALLTKITSAPTDDPNNAGFTVLLSAAKEVTEAGVPKVCPTDPDAYPLSVLVDAVVKSGGRTLTKISTRYLVGAER